MRISIRFNRYSENDKIRLRFTKWSCEWAKELGGAFALSV